MRKHDGPAAVGGSSLLVIFAVLCLVVFALLGLSSVQAEGRLSAACSNSVEEYYRADVQAEAILARLRGGEIPDGVTKDGTHYRYQCTVSDTQTLQVTVALQESDYQILQWQVISTVQWEAQDAPAVWDGTTGA